MAVESTALSLLALPLNLSSEISAARESLVLLQNPDGSWPTFAGDDQRGSGLTGLALYALGRAGESGPAVHRAVRWLLSCRGREGHWFWKWKFRISDRRVRFDPDKFGWPWTPETVSWVVPTAYSLLALRGVHEVSRRRLREFRIRRGIEMLQDRICPGGGWNAGNGVVHGSSIGPHADTTAVALLALASEPLSEYVAASIEWLRRRSQSLATPWSLAWTILALQAFKRPIDSLLNRLRVMALHDEIRDCATLAVACMAIDCADGKNPFLVHP